MNEKIKLIKKINFFKSLSNVEIKIINDISNITRYPKNSILHYENEVFNKIFFLASGLLKVYKIDKFDNEIFLYHIHEGSLISELTTLDSNAIQCFSNSEFIEDSTILEIDFMELKKLLSLNHTLNTSFINEVLLKTQQLHCVVNRELVFDATAKVAYMLSDDLKIFNSLQRQEVAFMLHIQPETLSRVLKKLKRSSIIDIENNAIIIIDKEALKKVYRG
ncbi:MAG: Crp/Fnr family transcriptional regulator [Campylobacterales bacterium]|nr:Crp/Fnr family transcriptional regulator [Campylobacterales bacterium]